MQRTCSELKLHGMHGGLEHGDGLLVGHAAGGGAVDAGNHVATLDGVGEVSGSSGREASHSDGHVPHGRPPTPSNAQPQRTRRVTMQLHRPPTCRHSTHG